jgi:hypothetical protein
MIKKESHQAAPMLMIKGTELESEEGVADLEEKA